MQHVVAMQLQPAADERRPDRSLHRLIVLEVPLGRDSGRLAEHDADDERTLLDPANAVIVGVGASGRGDRDRDTENQSNARNAS